MNTVTFTVVFYTADMPYFATKYKEDKYFFPILLEKTAILVLFKDYNFHVK